MRFPPTENHAHMPFVYRRNGNLEVLFGQCMPRVRVRRGKFVAARPSAWKLYWFMPGGEFVRRVPTGLDDHFEECSPSFSETKDGVQVSFLGPYYVPRQARKSAHGLELRLYVMRGPDVNCLEPATVYSEEQCYCGFARPDLAIMATEMNGNARIIGGRFTSLTTSFRQLIRISYCADAPSRILLTGRLSGRDTVYETIVVDVEAAEVLGALQIDGSASYKPSMLADLAVFPCPPSESRPWRLLSRDNYAIVPTSVKVELS